MTILLGILLRVATPFWSLVENLVNNMLPSFSHNASSIPFFCKLFAKMNLFKYRIIMRYNVSQCYYCTIYRSALVNNNVFAAFAVKWNFHKYIKVISTEMYASVHKFVQHQKSRQDRIQVEQVT